jgi:cation:H+ antiporter
MLLVAGATSLPEIVTDVSASLAGAPDLAVGDLFGSSMANMAVLAVIDLLHRHRVWPHVEAGHARVASVAIALTALATLGVLTPPGVALGWVGIDTLAIAVAYVAAVAWMRRSPTGRFGDGDVLPVPTGWTRPERGDLRPVVMRFALATGIIFVSAPVLAYSAKEIAAISGVGQTFVGTALLALSTSMPELVASIAAVRIGAHDLAVGNLFGSNAVNMAILVVSDVAYRPGPLLTAVDPSQAVAAIGAILLMALALAALVHGTETRVRRLEPDAILLLVAYVGALYAVWRIQP